MSIKKTITVIIPIYNSQEYLDETVKSILDQSIGLEKIQILLIDDGSTDNSLKICQQYAADYSESIKCYHKDNGGVSSAINMGLQYAEGKYVTSIGSDDKWSSNAFEEIVDFFEENYNQVDCVSGKIEIFGDLIYTHPLNFRYTKKRVIDLNEEPWSIQTTSGNVVYKAEAIKGEFFDEDIVMLEDVLFNTRVIKKKMAYGVVPEAICYYRKHASLTFNSKNNKDWYLEVPKKVLLLLINKSLNENNNKVDEYSQHVVAYFLRWRICTPEIDYVLTKEEKEKYTQMISDLLQYIDDHTIATIKNTYQYYKNYLYQLKYCCDIFEMARQEGYLFKIHDETIFSAIGRGNARITDIKKDLLNIYVSGTTGVIMAGERCSLHAEDMKGREIPIEFTDCLENNKIAFTGEILNRRKCFTLKLNRFKQRHFRFYTKIVGDNSKYYCKVTFLDGIEKNVMYEKPGDGVVVK